jgi:tetratricopeptide (TPR) repeat protein
MRQLLIICIFIAILSCSTERELSREERISTLEKTIDSLGYNWQDSLAAIYADSLLDLDSSNYIALRTKGFDFYNRQLYNEALGFLDKSLEINPNDTSAISFLGLSLDKLGNLDSAKYYYDILIPLLEQSPNRQWLLPKVVTITQGKAFGLRTLEDIRSELSEQFYFQMKNDISSYENEGMKAFYPLMNLPLYDFYIKIPNELFDAGQLNTTSKIHTFFAKRGINVMFKSSDSQNKACVISTSEKYLNKLSNFDSLSIKRL